MNGDAERINAQLERTYEPLRLTWEELRASHPGLSWPFLLKARQEYLDAPRRVMLMGQETFGWHDGAPGDPSPVAPIRRMMDLHGSCARGQDMKAGGSPFWAFAREVARVTSGVADERPLMWNNLVKVDDAARRARTEIRDKLATVKDAAGSTIHQSELSLLDPQVVLFVTGPSYDEDIARAFPGATFEAMGSCTSRQFSRVTIPAFDGVALRTYHPKYLRLRGQAVRQEVLATLRSLVQGS